jgi:hypothetical protein
MTDCILEAINSTMQANMSALTGRLCPSISRPQGGGKRRAELRFHGRYPLRQTTAAATSIGCTAQLRQLLFFGQL